MAALRHEIPTHLNVEDKAFYGLSARQVMYLTVGSALSYGLWNQAPDLPFAGRIALAVICLAVATALALVRPASRSLEEWAFIAVHYVAVPKASVWRPREPDPTSLRPGREGWEEMTPWIAWSEEPGDVSVGPKGGRW